MFVSRYEIVYNKEKGGSHLDVASKVERLTDQEKKIIQVLREVQFGEIRIVIQDCKPVRIDEIRKSIKI